MSNLFWVGGDGNWSDAGLVHWATSSGGTPGHAIPTATDIGIFDGNSGTGTGLGGGAKVTLDGTPTGAITLGTTGGNFVGTIDNSINNTSPTFSSLIFSGSGTRSLNMGTGTWTIKYVSGNSVDFTTTTGLTFSGSSATITVDPSSALSSQTLNFIGGGLTFGTINILGKNTANAWPTFSMSNESFTVGTLNITAPNVVNFPANQTVTILNPINWTGTPLSLLELNFSASGGTSFSTINIPASSSISWASMRGLHFTGNAISPTNSFDLGNNNFNGGTLSGPSGGGSSSGSIVYG